MNWKKISLVMLWIVGVTFNTWMLWVCIDQLLTGLYLQSIGLEINVFLDILTIICLSVTSIIYLYLGIKKGVKREIKISFMEKLTGKYYDKR